MSLRLQEVSNSPSLTRKSLSLIAARVSNIASISRRTRRLSMVCKKRRNKRCFKVNQLMLLILLRSPRINRMLSKRNQVSRVKSYLNKSASNS